MTTAETSEKTIPRLPALPRGDPRRAAKEFGYANVMQIPAWSRSSSTWVSATPPATPS